MQQSDKLQGQIRHALTAVGGALMAAGAITPEEWTGIADAAMAAAGALLALWGAVWSWRAKR